MPLSLSFPSDEYVHYGRYRARRVRFLSFWPAVGFTCRPPAVECLPIVELNHLFPYLNTYSVRGMLVISKPHHSRYHVAFAARIRVLPDAMPSRPLCLRKKTVISRLVPSPT